MSVHLGDPSQPPFAKLQVQAGPDLTWTEVGMRQPAGEATTVRKGGGEFVLPARPFERVIRSVRVVEGLLEGTYRDGSVVTVHPVSEEEVIPVEIEDGPPSVAT